MITEDHLKRFLKQINTISHESDGMAGVAQELAEVVQEILIATQSEYRLDYDHHDMKYYITKGVY
jgi:DNA polymerase III gamma/tau subunit